MQDEKLRALLAANAFILITMTGNSGCEVLKDGQEAPKTCSVSIIDANTSLHLELLGTVQPEVEITKFKKQVCTNPILCDFVP